MEKHILPTAQAIVEFGLMEYVLEFYEDGVRGLVRDHVLLVTDLLAGAEDRETFFDEDPLKTKIISMYENSLQYRNDVAMGVANKRLAEALGASETVRHWAYGMMYGIFPCDVLSVDVVRWRWLGNDLVVHISVWD